MTPRVRGLLVAIVHVALIASVGATLLYDRATLPRAWVETAGVDPDLPIRGRYVALRLLFPATVEPPPGGERDRARAGRIEVRDGRAVVVLHGDADDRPANRRNLYFTERATPAGPRWMLMEPVAFFLPEHAPDPTRDVAPGELWLEVSVPDRSAPRPIRLERRRVVGH
ncbi:MAG: hypothetical protein KBE42_15890 [Steroidobacteraceae bacterium]|nr:hypothetical protein [Steroidobacteraceae bacterium]